MDKTQFAKDEIRGLKKMLMNLLPRGKHELVLFFALLAFYLSFSFYLLFSSSIVDFSWFKLHDLYFSFDHIFIYHQGFENIEGHPLMALFMKPFIYIGSALGWVFGYKAKGVFLVSLCSTWIALSVVYTFRYLKQILGLAGYALYIIVLFFAFISTNLILCFTTETFTISTFLLAFTAYYYSMCIHQKREMTFSENFALAFALGGVTITNFAKGIIPMLFTPDKWKHKIIRIAIVGFLFALLLAFLEWQYAIFSEIAMRANAWGNVNVLGGASIPQKMVSYLMGAPMLFPDFYTVSRHAVPDMILFELYNQWWQFLFVIVVLGLILFSIIKNYNEPLVQMLVLMFGCDIFLHVICRYNVGEGFLYGGHWVYVLPLFVGWLYKSLGTKSRKGLITIMSVLLVVLVVNNLAHLFTFVQMAKEFYPVDYN